ncbi:MAG: ABC transporter ATP-binding protein [Clostridiales bacterium]|jgi:peptide/nickel transport system ATP-binding protein|nr:ABC transporter ATP-binding protein [Clostridiales bacterium]
MNELLELKNVSIEFESNSGFFRKKRNVKAVSNVNLEVKAGEILAVVGESGCGKTTIGKMITGIYKPTSGQVLFDGKDIWNLSKREYYEYRKSVQMVHQDSYAALNPARTIFQSLSAPLLHHKLAKNVEEARRKLEELFMLVGLTPSEQFLDKYPHQLSGGQRQRILLARAISVRPRLIVADEPVSMVDVSLRISLLDLMADMNKKFNIAFIYITHDLATARYIASNGRIAVMYLGKIVEVGNLEQILSRPRHPYLQALLSAVPIPNPRVARNAKPLPLKSPDMPDPANPPAGCRFNPRCPYAEEICTQKEPVLNELDGEMVACHMIERIPDWKWETAIGIQK